MFVIGAAVSTALVLALGAWLFPRSGDRPISGLAWRDYEAAKRQGCDL